MTSYWCEHAVLPGGVRRSVRVVTDAGRIVDVQAGAAAEPGDVTLPGVVLPGLANAHSHAFHRALRGRTHDDGGNFWTWRDAMYAVTHRLDPESLHALAKAVFAEMLLAGYTTVGEFHYVHHAPGGRRYDDPNVMGKALLSAAREAGIRITLLDTCYLAGGLTAGGHLPSTRCRSASATARSTPGRRGWTTSPAATRPGSARPCTRCGPCRATTSPRWGSSRRGMAAPARAPVRAARREPRVRGVLRVLTDRAAVRRGAARADDDGRARDAPLRQGRPAARRGAHNSVLLPHHRARPGRRHRPRPTPPRRGSVPGARLRPAGRHRPVRGAARRRDARAPREHGARAVRRRRPPRDGHPVRLPLARLERRRARREGPPRRPRRRAARQPAHRRVRPGPRSSTPRRRPTSGDVVVHGERVVTGGQHRAGDVGRMLADAIARSAGERAGRRRSTVVTGIRGRDLRRCGRRGCRCSARSPRPPRASGSCRTPRSSSRTAWSPGWGRRHPPPRPTGVDVGGRAVVPGSSTATATSSTRATARRSSPRGWPAPRTTAAGSGSRWPPPEPPPTTSCATCCTAGSPRCGPSGTTTVEVKSGYGLTRRGRGALAAPGPGRSPARRPSSARTSCRRRRAGTAAAYLDLVCGPMLAACAPHARWVDVFCEPASAYAFTEEEARRVLVAGRDAGLGLRVHGNQLSAGPGCASRSSSARGERRPLHLPHRGRRRGPRRGRRDHRGDAAPRGRVLDALAVPGRARTRGRRRRRRARDRLQPGHVQHVVDALRHRTGRAGDADDGGRGRRGGDRRRGAGVAARGRRAGGRGVAGRPRRARGAVVRAPRVPAGDAAGAGARPGLGRRADPAGCQTGSSRTSAGRWPDDFS